MPFTEIMGKYKRGQLHSGSKFGPKVKNRKQAVAIMLSEKREAMKGKHEYGAKGMKHGGMADMEKYHNMSQKDYDAMKKKMGYKHGGMAQKKQKRGFASIPRRAY